MLFRCSPQLKPYLDNPYNFLLHVSVVSKTISFAKRNPFTNRVIYNYFSKKVCFIILKEESESTGNALIFHKDTDWC